MEAAQLEAWLEEKSALREPYRPSNGTEGDIFMDRWCFRCERERLVMAGEADPSEGCEILANAMAGLQPKEWTCEVDDDWTRSPPDSAACSAFIPEGEDAPQPLDPRAVIRPLL